MDRCFPDVAALAGRPCYDLIFLGRDFPNGGNSDSTPLWAALVARINANIAAPKKQHFLPPLLYQNGANGKPRGEIACHDCGPERIVPRFGRWVASSHRLRRSDGLGRAGWVAIVEVAVGHCCNSAAEARKLKAR
ncbi:MAG: hypothetical protein WB795_09945 [Candidatus Acidiferrales bacterium]